MNQHVNTENGHLVMYSLHNRTSTFLGISSALVRSLRVDFHFYFYFLNTVELVIEEVGRFSQHIHFIYQMFGLFLLIKVNT